jgi:putative sterol carrier protein
VEAGWQRFDDVFATLGQQGWSKRFTKAWTYAEIPYHLAYFDGMIAQYLAFGPDIPPGQELYLRTMGELNEWNRREFAKRPTGHTVEDSLAAMRTSRDTIRRLAAGLREQDLDRRSWMPLMFGWSTARTLLQAAIVHNVAEYWKLWLRTGKRAAAPTPAAVHLRLDFMMCFMPATLNRQVAVQQPFTMVWDFDGPGGGAWTLAVANGSCTVTEGAAVKPDLTMSMQPQTFQKLTAKMESPVWLMLTRQMKVKGLRAMGTFGKLFPEPKPDQVFAVDPSLTRGVAGP